MTTVKKDYNEKKRLKKIIIMLIVIFLILLLIKSCASEFNWTIGRIFGSSSKHEITEESDKPIILNENLKFDIDENENIVIDDEYKISFDIEKINSDEFTCTTSDANIATCYVKDGYVVVNPKSDGKVTIHVQTTTNDKIYQASTTIDVLLPVGTFSLSQTKGTIVLSKTNKKIITYSINNIDGEVEAISNNEDIATVSVSKGTITINAKKSGSTTIVVSVVDKKTDKKYQVVYKLDVVKGNNNVIEKPNQNENNSVTKDSNNFLEYIKVSNSKLNPQFDKNTLNYNINVENNINKIGFLIKQDSNKSTVKYIFNDKKITDISDLSLNVGDNTLKVEVTSENNQVRTYIIVINRKDSNPEISTYLNNLVINGYNLNPLFNKETNFYNLEVMYNQSSISLQYNLEDKQNNISFSINGDNITDLSNINLKDGNNILEIKINNSKSEKVYVVNIYKPVRKIEFYESNYDIYIEQAPYYINYKVLEDNIEITDYDIKDIDVKIDSFNGTYKLYQGYIEIIPTSNDVNKNYDLNITYNNVTDTVKLKLLTKDYYIDTPTSKYDISYVNGSGNKNIIINNNILVGNITKTNISNGFRLSTPNGAYIDIIKNDNLVDVSFDRDDSSNNSLVLTVKALSTGKSQITVNGYIFGNKIGSYDINFNIKEKYKVTIDANGGFFNSFTTKYSYLLEKDDIIKLEEYDAKKVSDEENCLFFTLDSFNTKSNGAGVSYNKNDTLTNFDGDITLYAIYTTTASYQQVLQNERLYLTEIDLFHNDEYYEKYNVDKIIYPSAEGAHVMSITNNGIGKIRINKINLEENTMCLSKGNCINIGYIIKSALDVNEPYTYFYGSKDGYTILNKDNKTRYTSGITTDYHTINNIDINPNIEIEVGETKEISILWKWVEVDDKLDTYFGTNYSSFDDEYSLTISIDFERESTTCNLP